MHGTNDWNIDLHVTRFPFSAAARIGPRYETILDRFSPPSTMRYVRLRNSYPAAKASAGSTHKNNLQGFKTEDPFIHTDPFKSSEISCVFIVSVEKIRPPTSLSLSLSLSLFLSLAHSFSLSLTLSLARSRALSPVSYTHLTLPTRRTV